MITVAIAYDAAPIVATSPPVAQPHRPTAGPSNPSDGAKHSSLVLIICIGAGIAMVIVIMVLVICACTSKRGKSEVSKEISPTDIGMFIGLACLLCYVFLAYSCW